MSGKGDRPDKGLDRRFLFLQGPLSPLYHEIGRLLCESGFLVRRVNLCAGDWLQWHDEKTLSYRGKAADWSAYVRDLMEREQITDLVLHGDQRLYHKAAIREAQDRQIRVFVTELGLLRSGWMTLEREGLATLSRFPNDPDAIRSVSMGLGKIDFSPAYPKSAWLEIVPDVIYNLANVVLQPLFPHYQRHTIYHPIPEYLHGAWRLVRESKRMWQADRQIKELVASGRPYFILPLQLEGDFQLRAHSPYKSFAEVIETVVLSFAAHASANACLVLKTHPLDVGFENWPELVKRLAASLDLEKRIVFLDGGRMSDLFPAASGLVTLNSTAGLEALQTGVPVKTLVPAHYDVAGLTFAGTLDDFWQAPMKPDGELLNHYLRALAGTIQVRGSIHNREGASVAARNIADRLSNLSVNEPGALCSEPPRLERARQLGVPL